MGVDPPFEQTHGQITDHFRMNNDWWKRFGLVKKDHDPSAAIKPSVLKRVVEMSE